MWDHSGVLMPHLRQTIAFRFIYLGCCRHCSYTSNKQSNRSRVWIDRFPSVIDQFLSINQTNYTTCWTLWASSLNCRSISLVKCLFKSWQRSTLSFLMMSLEKQQKKNYNPSSDASQDHSHVSSLTDDSLRVLTNDKREYFFKKWLWLNP